MDEGTPSVTDVILTLFDPSNGLTDAGEVMLGVSRILSKLSLNTGCLEAMGYQHHINNYMTVITKYQDDKVISVLYPTRYGANTKFY